MTAFYTKYQQKFRTAIEKTYTPSELNRMVNGGQYPEQIWTFMPRLIVDSEYSSTVVLLLLHQLTAGEGSEHTVALHEIFVTPAFDYTSGIDNINPVNITRIELSR